MRLFILKGLSIIRYTGIYSSGPVRRGEGLRGGVSPCGATYFARDGKVGKTPPGTRPSELRLHVVPPRFTRPSLPPLSLSDISP